MFWEYEPGTYLPWISPTPLLMVVAARRSPDGLGPGDRRVRAGARAEAARVLAGGHFDAYVADFERSSGAARDWFVAAPAAGAREHASVAVSGGDEAAQCAVRRARRPWRASGRPCGPAAPISAKMRGDARARAAAGDLDAVGEVADQRHAEADAGAVRARAHARGRRRRRRPRRPRRPGSPTRAPARAASRSRYACTTAFVTASDTTTPTASRSTAIPLSASSTARRARDALGARPADPRRAGWPPQPCSWEGYARPRGFTPTVQS